jgi:hypothetical protein
MAGNITIPVD